MPPSILVNRRGDILEITLNRPETYNAFDLDMMIELGDALATAATESSVKGVLITGAGRAFCAGGDLKWISQQAGDAGPTLHRLAPQFHIAVTEIRRMAKPVTAAVNGIAAGGGFSLALACDFRVMAESAVLIQGYTSNGLSMDGGGTFALPRLVGLARALEIAAFDQPIPASKALEWGLATKVTPDAEVRDEALVLLERLAKTSLHSFAWSKRLLLESFHNTLETQLELERQGISACAGHPDGQEGIRAFVEKRKPSF
ncbi:MAG: enoyl-CoA hydratase/isomerase family protein [Chloroflexi bacterium]|nr:enoyl-CoA hydratase/isomerase family protein [Chloroflexota bacterium]